MPAHRIDNVVRLKGGADLEGFRRAARGLIALQTPPDMATWTQGQSDLFGDGAAPVDGPPLTLPRGAGDLIALVVCHTDPERYSLLYRLVWRLLHGERRLLDNPSDPLVHRLYLLAKAVRRDLHKMHAFVRFREAGDAPGAGDGRMVAWFEPDFFIVEAAAGFFVDRFPAFAWSILTPVGSLHWDRERLAIGPPGRRGDAPRSDPFEQGWVGYYESTFNPARTNPDLMRKEMPRKYWKNLPEAAAIDGLVRSAPSRVQEMVARQAVPMARRDPVKAVAAMSDQDPKSLAELNRVIASAPPLVPGATQAVLGEGPLEPALAFVGEQPGDQEDLQGHPFVGPAGQLLDRALAQAGIDRRKAYLTNAVKHFKFEQRGKRRLHQSPTAGEVKHYRWWLDRELDFVRPRVTVALGATAVLALAGKPLPITRNRGPADFHGRPGFITVHPSYLLRLQGEAEKQQAFEAFVADLRAARGLAGQAEAA